MAYPVSDHCDGKRFFNPEPPRHPEMSPRGGLMRMLKMLRERRSGRSAWARWPARVENRPYPPPDPARPSVTWIGHNTFLLRLGGLNVLTDPIFSERCSPVRFAGPARVRAPGLAIAALPPVDLILLSHNHYDHMDLPSLKRLRQRFPAARLITTLGNAGFLTRQGLAGAVELDWWESVTLHGAHVTATPARHFSARTLWDRNETLWAGFMLNWHGHRIYYAGDTGYTKFFSEIRHRLGAPDLALLPIGAYQPREVMATVHTDPAEAVRAFQDLHAGRAIGMHFGTFQLTQEAIDAPERELAQARERAGLAPEAFFTLDVGESAPL